MKRLLITVLVASSICFVGCGEESYTAYNTTSEATQEKRDERTLATFVDIFSKKNVYIDINEKPMFSMIGAIDGVIFYMDNNPVKIYEYESENKLEQEIENNAMLNQFERNGKFLLESSFDEAKEIFKSVK